MNIWTKPCPICLKPVAAGEYIRVEYWGQTRLAHRGKRTLEHIHLYCWERLMKGLANAKATV